MGSQGGSAQRAPRLGGSGSGLLLSGRDMKPRNSSVGGLT